ncbi:hypothetical protein GCM10009677_12970 [Sphaerisporangium rubeum]
MVLADDDTPDLRQGLLQQAEIGVGALLGPASATAFFGNGHAAHSIKPEAKVHGTGTVRREDPVGDRRLGTGPVAPRTTCTARP